MLKQVKMCALAGKNLKRTHIIDTLVMRTSIRAFRICEREVRTRHCTIWNQGVDNVVAPLFEEAVSWTYATMNRTLLVRQYP